MEKENISRRDFLKRIGVASVTTAGLTACVDGTRDAFTGKAGNTSADNMTFRTNPKSGKKVSLLGYGCMRWPTRPKKDGSGEEIDQDAVNEMVDYAIAHGVNYFDTAPNYVQGLSEEATGIALHRHPRNKYFIATKISNFSPEQQTFDGAVELYRNSFRRLQVDYIDYLLLHGVGMGGIELLEKRF